MTTSGGTRRGALRRVMAVVLTLPMAGVALVATAPAASAGITQPGSGAEYTLQSSRVTISADFGRSTGSGSQRLYLTAPGGSETLVDSADGNLNGGTLNHAFDLDCWTASCRLAPNGTWTVRQAGESTADSVFVTKIRPAAPSEVAAAPVSSREARITWRRGAEPDLTGFEIVEGDEVVRPGIGLSACDGSTCSAAVTYAVDGSGAHTYAVRAFRSTAPGASSTLASSLSSTASTRLDPPAPSPEPAPTDGSTGGSSGGDGGTSSPGAEPAGEPAGEPTTGSDPDGGSGTGGGSTAGGDSGSSTGSPSQPGSTAPIGTKPGSSASADRLAVAQRKAFALGFSAFGPKLGIPKLPPLPQAQPPAIAPELADGSYEPTLGFEDQVLTERVEVAQGPTARVRQVMGSALDAERLATSTAAALVLLLAGAHLRRWVGVAHSEEH